MHVCFRVSFFLHLDVSVPRSFYSLCQCLWFSLLSYLLPLKVFFFKIFSFFSVLQFLSVDDSFHFPRVSSFLLLLLISRLVYIHLCAYTYVQVSEVQRIGCRDSTLKLRWCLRSLYLQRGSLYPITIRLIQLSFFISASFLSLLLPPCPCPLWISFSSLSSSLSHHSSRYPLDVNTYRRLSVWIDR